MKLTRETEILGEKTCPVPLCPLQIPRGLTRVSAVRGRRLSRPSHGKVIIQGYRETNMVISWVLCSWWSRSGCGVYDVSGLRLTESGSY
jgi:hypothetical protein